MPPGQRTRGSTSGGFSSQVWTESMLGTPCSAGSRTSLISDGSRGQDTAWLCPHRGNQPWCKPQVCGTPLSASEQRQQLWPGPPSQPETPVPCRSSLAPDIITSLKDWQGLAQTLPLLTGATEWAGAPTPGLSPSGATCRRPWVSPASEPAQPAPPGHADPQPEPCLLHCTANTSRKSPSAELEGATAYLWCRFYLLRLVASREGNL